MSGKFGVKGGNYRSQNHQAGGIIVETDGSGNGSGNAEFRQPMKKVPHVVPGFYGKDSSEALSSGNVTAVMITRRGFRAIVKGASVKNGTVKVSYDAFDDTYR